MKTASIEAQQRSRAFARVIGPYVAAFTTLYAIRLPDGIDVLDDLFTQPGLVMLLGTFMFLAGLIVIGLHRNWRGPLAITVSLFGWFVALRGFALIMSPDAMQAGVEATMGNPTTVTVARIGFAAMAVMGLLLTYAGWFSRPAATNSAAPSSTVTP
ncbi:hypothetical protein [Glycomyces sp. NPDC047010]|uniref:hypothetical protein n=1 Tax=Glycomyces sp. NPDC047010 TaxID=3155023 RepID=UPI0033D9A803